MCILSRLVHQFKFQHAHKHHQLERLQILLPPPPPPGCFAMEQVTSRCCYAAYTASIQCVWQSGLLTTSYPRHNIPVFNLFLNLVFF